MHGDILPEWRDLLAGGDGRRVDVSMRWGMDGGDMWDGTNDNVGAICVRSDCDCSGIGSGSGSADIAAGETISVTTVHKGCESGHSRQRDEEHTAATQLPVSVCLICIWCSTTLHFEVMRLSSFFFFLFFFYISE